ncbi:hypothetical protein B0H19DRAFT_224087 [Mycena capillaripes]|nr:hypothetical protein B0H19DRAFT_224087 [Mycena capillaripes]
MVDTTANDSDASSTVTSHQSPKRLSAPQWAATDEGRASFRKQFRILYSRPRFSDNPRAHLLAPQIPPARWAKRKMVSLKNLVGSHSCVGYLKNELLKVVGDEAAYAPTPRRCTEKAAFYEAWKANLLAFFANTVSQKTTTTRGIKEKTGKKNMTLLTAVFQNWKLLLWTLRTEFPPLGPQTWSVVTNRLIDLAIEPYEWALEYPRFTPPPLAMPRADPKGSQEAPPDLLPLVLTRPSPGNCKDSRRLLDVVPTSTKMSQSPKEPRIHGFRLSTGRILHQ